MQHLGHHAGEPRPAGGLLLKLRPALGSKRVIASPAMVLRDTPLRRNPPPPVHSVKGGIERSLLDLKRVVGQLLQPSGDAVAMHRSPGESLEDEHVEGALEQLAAHGKLQQWGLTSPLDRLWRR